MRERNGADSTGNLPDAIVLARLAEVEGLIVNAGARSGERGGIGVDDVTDVHQWTPRRTVALQQDLAGRHGMADEVVDDNVRAQPAGEVGLAPPSIVAVDLRHRAGG